MGYNSHIASSSCTRSSCLLPRSPQLLNYFYSSGLRPLTRQHSRKAPAHLGERHSGDFRVLCETATFDKLLCQLRRLFIFYSSSGSNSASLSFRRASAHVRLLTSSPCFVSVLDILLIVRKGTVVISLRRSCVYFAAASVLISTNNFHAASRLASLLSRNLFFLFASIASMRAAWRSPSKCLTGTPPDHCAV